MVAPAQTPRTNLINCRADNGGLVRAARVTGERGKLKETHHLDVSPYKDVSNESLEQEIKRLEEQLGYRKPEVLSE